MGADELLYSPAQTKRATPAVDAVRGFVFTSGLRWIERHGLVERYRDLLPATLRGELGAISASEWLPLDTVMASYDACDQLGLSVEEQIDVGRSVSEANNGIFVRTVARLAGRLGASPWLGLKHADKAWQRSNRGGAIAVYRIDERTARLEYWHVPMARSPFFVTSMRGAVAVGLEVFCERVLVTEVAELTTRDGFSLRVKW